MFNRFIKTAADLVTTHEQTRAGFLSIALEKNKIGDPYVKRALAFKSMVVETTSPDDFLRMPEIRPFLLTAAGLSDKSMNYLTTDNQTAAIRELIDKFLKPSGQNYIDETIYRYLLIKGDAVGGTMRNRIGAMGQERLIRTILSCLNIQGLHYRWLQNSTKIWFDMKDNDSSIEQDMKALSWTSPKGNRTLSFNLTLPIIKKNVDLCLFAGDWMSYNNGKIVKKPEHTLMLGELKGGIDPAGADEHWKTANTALSRIRNNYQAAGIPIKSSFVGAAIEYAMAEEIFEQLQTGLLANAANLTNSNQLVEYCNWLIML